MGSRQSGQTWSAAALSCILLLPSLCYASSQIAPISVPVGTDWFGYDGQWSPVNIRVGTPPQWLSVFPSTASQETWVVGRYGCDGSFECRNLRGNLFEQNASSTWKEIGFYELDMDTNLGFNGYGEYGWDTIALDQYVVSPHQAIGIVNSTEYWLGYLGLGIRHINFTDNNALTYLSTLVENQSYIPSHSYGYTAGAYYRLKNVPSSLTLGGVDTNRFEPNDVNFALAPQQVPVVAINSITVKSIPLSTSTSDPPWSANPLTLLGPADASLFTIDSSTPYLWLPETVCDAFAKAFGLTYNDTLELYTFDGNTTAHDTLVNWNMTFTFNIADLPQSTHSIDITLPYDAFDLQLSYPYPELWANASSAAVNYFPLKRAANDTQYTIGRAFLQETYLAVDYERNNFSVSQARFAMDSLTNQNIVAITRPKNSTLAGPIGVSDGSSGISKGAIAGIAVGAALILALVALFFFFRRRKSRSHSPDTSLDKPDKNGKRRKGKFLYKLLGGPSDVAPTEMAGDKYHPTEVPADNENSRFELVGSNSPIELPGSDLSSYQSTKRSYGNNLSAYDATARKLDGPPAPPAELSHSHSTAKNPDAGFYAPPSNSPNLPAYSPEAAGRQPGRSPHNSHNVSPGPSPGVSTINPTGQPPRERAGDNVSRSSSQFTSPTFSPLTPPTPSRAIPAYSNGMPSPYVSSNTESGGAGSDTRSSLGVAGPGLPRRSTSRGSRFVEEGISTGSSSGNEEVFREAREAHQRQQIEAAEHARQQQQRQLARRQQEQQQQSQPQPQQRQRQPGRLDAPDERSRRFSWEE